MVIHMVRTEDQEYMGVMKTASIESSETKADRVGGPGVGAKDLDGRSCRHCWSGKGGGRMAGGCG